jgi:hypothetical protein
MGVRELYRTSSLASVDEYLSQGGFTMVITDDADVKKWRHAAIQVHPFEVIVQTAILGAFPDET